MNPPEPVQASKGRADALAVPCKFCHAPTGQPCVNTINKTPLANFAAHLSRIKQADNLEPF
jgi:hypothetical protein